LIAQAPEQFRVDRKSRPLSEDEVRQIGRIIEILDRSAFDHLQLEFGDLKLTIGKSGAAAAATNVSAAAQNAVPVATTTPPQTPSPSPAKNDGTEDDTVAVTAPLLGRFYSQPEPGAAPFVSIGSKVGEDTTVGLIEVMKTFNAVRAGVSGTVTEISVQDAELVEYGQVLLRVRPQAP
jgi:acetyl-CoA carboxylase biotin carboxyl carrier protein